VLGDRPESDAASVARMADEVRRTERPLEKICGRALIRRASDRRFLSAAHTATAADVATQFLYSLRFLSLRRELLQSEFGGLTGFLPRWKLDQRLFYGKASWRAELPTIPVRRREPMRHYDVQLRSRPRQRRV
jgi:hypothetical protein